LLAEDMASGDPSVGDAVALKALVASASGDVLSTRAFIKEARSISATAESRFYCAFAELIDRLEDEEPRGVGADLEALVLDAVTSECQDAFVLAYRARPELLQLAADRPGLRKMMTEIVGRARDQTLGSAAGLSVDVIDPIHAVLSKRELEVLGLLHEGMNNTQIAERLVISTSTAKVHVHNIKKKLGVRTRLEATLRFDIETP
jgi:DNA-binding CsgD family transcriptional regulator